MEDTLGVVPSLGRKIIELRDRRAAKEIFCALIDGKSVGLDQMKRRLPSSMVGEIRTLQVGFTSIRGSQTGTFARRSKPTLRT